MIAYNHETNPIQDRSTVDIHRSRKEKTMLKNPGSTLFVVFLIFTHSVARCSEKPLEFPDPAEYTCEDALRMQRSANGVLVPVYAPLADWIVNRLDLAAKQGIGIDLGSGPGNLILELCKRTERMHWVNVDINPSFFPLFYDTVNAAGYGHRISAIFADAKRLPFRDGYADAIVSRGSYPFWGDLNLAFGEVYRVLKSGGMAFIGRGFPETLPPETARAIRNQQGKKKGSVLDYESTDSEVELKTIMEALGIKEYRIILPKPAGSEGVNYGIWIEIKKPE